MVDIEVPSPNEVALIRSLVEEHVERTASPLGVMMLYRFNDIARYFKKVIPREYRRVVKLTEMFKLDGFTHEEAVERAFEALQTGE